MSVWRSLSRKFRNKKHCTSKCAGSIRKHSPIFESLEPRLLMSGDFSYAVSEGGLFATLRVDQQENVSVLKLIDNEDGTCLPFVNNEGEEYLGVELSDSDPTNVEIIGGNEADYLAIDSSAIDAISVVFDGGGGQDALTFLEAYITSLSPDRSSVTASSGVTVKLPSSSVEQFGDAVAGTFPSQMSYLSSLLQKMTTKVLNGQIPFAQNTKMCDVIQLSEAFQNEVMSTFHYYDDADTPVLTFSNLPELVELLNAEIHEEDGVGQVLSFDLKIADYAFDDIERPVDFRYDLSPLAVTDSDGTVIVGGTVSLDLKVNYDLDTGLIAVLEHADGSDPSISGSLSIASDDIVVSEAAFGIVGIAARAGILASQEGKFSLNLADPSVDDDGKIYLAEMSGALKSTVTVPNLVPDLDVSGNVTLSLMDLQVTPDVFGLNALLDETAAIAISVSDMDDPSTIAVTTDAAIGDLAGITPKSVETAFGRLEEYVTGLSIPFLTDALPMLGVSPEGVAGYLDILRKGVESLSTVGTIQTLEGAIEVAFGLEHDPAKPIVVLTDDGILKFNLDLERTTTIEDREYTLQFGQTPLTLAGEVTMNMTASAAMVLAFGIDLADPAQMYIYDDTSLEFSLWCFASNLAFSCGINSSNLSKTLPVDIKGGMIDLGYDSDEDGTLDAPVKTVWRLKDSPDGRYLLGDVTEADCLLTLDGAMEANLPVCVDSVSLGAITFVLPSLATLSDFTATFPELADRFDKLVLDGTLKLAGSGLKTVLSGIQGLLDNKVFNKSWPIVGDELANAVRFVEQINASIIDGLDDFSSAQAIAEKLNTILSSYSPDGRAVTLLFDTGEVYFWEVDLEGTFLSGEKPFEFDLGLPGLGMELQGDVDVEIGWNCDFTFGISLADGFFLVTEDGTQDGLPIKGDKLSVDVTVATPNLNGTGSLGCLELTASDLDSKLQASFQLDIQEEDGDSAGNRLCSNELNRANIVPTITHPVGDGSATGVQAAIRLDLTLGVINPSEAFDGVADWAKDFTFPSIYCDFSVDWTFLDPENESTPPAIRFEDVSLDLGTFLTQFATPVFAGIKNALGPFVDELEILGGKSFLDVLTEPIEAITKLNDKCGTEIPDTFIGLAAKYGDVSDNWESVVDTIEQVVKIANTLGSISLPASSEPLVIEFGSFSLQGGQSAGSLGDPVADDGNVDLPDWTAQVRTKVEDQEGLKEFSDLATKGALAFPFLSTPGELFNLLLGSPVDIFTFDLPRIEFEFPFAAPPFRFWGVLKLGLGGDVSFALDLGFGFDSYGLQEYATHNYENPFDILKGFYVSDTEYPDGTGVDVPEITFSAGITGTMSLDVWVAEAGVAAGIVGEIELDLDDPIPEPDGAGKIRVSELWYNLKKGYEFFRGKEFSEAASIVLSPIGLFNTHGEVRAEMYVYYDVLGKDPKKWPDPPYSVELLSFDWDIARDYEAAAKEVGVPTEDDDEIDDPASNVVDGDWIIDVAEYTEVAKDRAEKEASELYDAHRKEILDRNRGRYDRIVSVEKSRSENVGDFFVRHLGGSSSSEDVQCEIDVTIAYAGLITFSRTTKTDTGAYTTTWQEDIRGTSTQSSSRTENGISHITVNGGELGGGVVCDGILATSTIVGSGGSDRIYLSAYSGASAAQGASVIRGGEGEDWIYGGMGDDEIYGDAGVDHIWGQDGTDTIHGGTESDVIYGGAGDDDIYGDTSDDYIEGNGEDDTIHGGAGSDTIYGSAGVDRLYGEDDSDTIHGGSEKDYIYGGDHGDFLRGDSGDDEIYGEDGNDTIYGGAGDDRIYGGAGMDVLHGEDGTDQIYGGTEKDYIYGGNHKDYLYGEGGDDEIQGGAGDDYIEGNDGIDTIRGGAENDEIHGKEGGDLLYGEDGNDTIYGGAGDDCIEGNDGDDEIHGDAARDIIYGNAGNDRIYGGADNDILIGDDGDVSGTQVVVYVRVGDGDGSDTIYGQEGEDKILGGGGNDFLYGDATGRSDSSQKRDIILGDGGTIQYGSGFAFDDVTEIRADSATGGNDTIQGNEGDDVILAGTGGDTDVQGNDGHDIILGDNGVITLSDGILVNLSTKGYSAGDADTLGGGEGSDLLVGGPGGDTIRGEKDNDVLIGDNGVVVATTIEAAVEGTDGDDTIYGLEGEDKILGGGGGDHLYGDVGAGDDGSQTRDIIFGDGGKIVYAGDRFSFGSVSSITNQSESDGGADTIEGNAGDDVILGGPGSDPSVRGGDGRDVILGDNGTVTLSGGVIQKVEGYGDGGVDFLYGDADSDIIMGGCQGDTLEGGQSDDILIGDAGVVDGSQVVAYVGGGDGSDTIYGQEGEDKILGGGGGDFLYGDKNTGPDGSLKRDILLGDGGTIAYSGDKFSFEAVMSLLVGAGAPGGSDTIEGNEGDDIVLGGAAGDSIQGNDGNDILLGDDGTVVLSAGTVQSITGGSAGGADSIEGQEGNDLVLGGGEADTLRGDNGNDTILGDDGTILLTTGVVKNIVGGIAGGADTIQGNEGDDIVLGGGAGDSIQGNVGNDIILGDDGTILLSAGVVQSIVGGSAGGADTIEGNEGDDIVLGGGAGDTIRGDAGNDILLGDDGTVLLSAGIVESIDGGTAGGVDVIEGNDGEDIVLGGAAGDSIKGNTGNDVLIGDGGAVELQGGVVSQISTSGETVGGTDTVEGNEGSDIVLGGVDGDWIYGQDGNDILIGDNGTVAPGYAEADSGTGDGSDHVYGQAGEDKILGGGAGDSLYGDNNQDGGASASPGRDILLGDGGRISYASDKFSYNAVTKIEGSVRAGDGADTIEGNEQADIVLGGGAGDAIKGNAGNDSLIGDGGTIDLQGGMVKQINTVGQTPGGADSIEGNSGNDIILGGANGSSDVIRGNDGDDVILGDNGLIRFDLDGNLSTRDLVQSADDGIGGADILYGDAGSDIVIGGPGGDRMHGDKEPDVLVGDEGRVDHTEIKAYVRASDGSDSIYGDAGEDKILGGGKGDVLVGDNAESGAASSAPGREIIIGDGGRIVHLVGRRFAFDAVSLVQTIEPATGGDDWIYGNQLQSLLMGGAGNDRIYGHTMTDWILGDNGVARFAPAGVLVELRTSDPLHGGKDTIDADNGPDVVMGGTGNDWISAGGDDQEKDVVLGDNGRMTFEGTETFDPGEEYSILSFNLNANASQVTGVAGAPGMEAGNWTNIFGADPTAYGDDAGEVVRFDDGRIAPGVTLGWRWWTGVVWLENQSQIEPGDDQDLRLFDGCLLTAAGDKLKLTVAGLADHFQSFDVYVYIDADDYQSDAVRSVRRISDGATSYYQDDVDGNNFAGTYAQITSTNPLAPSVGNYVVFSGLSGDGATIEISSDMTLLDSWMNRPTIAGIQIIGRHYPIDRIETTDPSSTGNDTILTGGGPDVVFGGSGNDSVITCGNPVYGSLDEDVVVGDNARATYMLGEMRDVHTTYWESTGNDTLITGNGEDLVFGGGGDDTINTGVYGTYENGDIQAISLNFNGGASEAMVTGVAGAVQVGNWNNLVGGGRTVFGDTPGEQIQFNDGSQATGITVEWGRGLDEIVPLEAEGDTNDQISNPGTQNERLFEGYLRTWTCDTLGVNLTGLDVFDTPYDVYVYVDMSDRGTTWGDPRIADAVSAFYLNDPDGNVFHGEFVEVTSTSPEVAQVGNYVVFRGLTADTMKIRIDDVSGQLITEGGYPAITAIQIVGGTDRSDIVVGGDHERDVVVGDNGAGVLFHDLLWEVRSSEVAAGGIDDILTGEDTDLVMGGAGSDVIDGEDGHDVLLGDNGHFTLFKGRLIGLDAGKFTDEWDGSVRPYEIGGILLLADHSGGSDRLVGGRGDDLLYGQFGDDTYVFAGSGLGRDALVEAGNGDAAERVNDSHDLLDFTAFDGTVCLDLRLEGMQTVNNRVVDGEINSAVVLFSGTAFEDVLGSGFNDVIDGNLRDNMLDGQAGDDTLRSRDGDDVVYGRSGNDTILAGTENDYVHAGSGDDVVCGSAGIDEIHGGPGNDRLDGEEGGDSLYGEDGNDLISGGFGNDYIEGGAGDDEVYGNCDNDEIHGGAGNDYLSGGKHDDVIEGDAGNDYLHGDDDNIWRTEYDHDRLAGGAGDDVIQGGGGRNMIYFPGATKGVVVELTDPCYGTATDGLGGTDSLLNIRGAIGTEFADILIGDSQDNVFYGMDGDDYLYGFSGDDYLDGGRGNDLIDGGDAENILITTAGDTIIEIPEVTISMRPSPVVEDGSTSLVYTFTRSASSPTPLTVNFSVGGTAILNTDYVQAGGTIFGPNSGSVTFGANEKTAVITIDPVTDSVVEPNELVTLVLMDGAGYTLGSASMATGAIMNDDHGQKTDWPDLQVITVDSSVWQSAAPGTPVDWTATVKNTGRGYQWADWTIQWYLSSNKKLDGSDILIGSATYTDDIAPGKVVSKTYQAAVPVVSQAGQMYVVARVTNAGPDKNARNDTVAAKDKDWFGAVESDADMVNNTRETAKDLSYVGGTFAQDGRTLEDADDVDWYRFTTLGAAGTSSRVRIDSASGEGDLALGLYGEDGTLLKEIDGKGKTEQLRLSGLAEGTYYIKVWSNRGDVSRNYKLTIAAPASPDLQVTAVDSSIGQSAEPGTVVDWLVAVKNNGTGYQRADWTVQWYLSSDRKYQDTDLPIGAETYSEDLAPKDSVSKTYRTLVPVVPVAGQMYVIARVENKGPDKSIKNDIRVTQDRDWFGAVAVDSYEDNDSLASASNLGFLTGPQVLASQTIDCAEDVDWYCFTMQQIGTLKQKVTIDSEDTEGDLALSLYRSDGALVQQVNGTHGRAEVKLNGQLAGIYYLKVLSPHGDVSPGYKLTMIA